MKDDFQTGLLSQSLSFKA